jgi:hypothetical protein
MFANPTQHVGISQRVVATLVACAVMMASLGLYNIATAHAANLTNVSDTLSDSDISVVSNHTIAFTIPAGSSGVAAGGTITVTFPAGFNMGSVAVGDIDFKINGAQQTLAGAAAGATWGATKAGQVVTLTSGTGTVAAGQTVTILIGTNATQGGSGVNQITNPTAGSYELYITAGTADTGRTRVAILSHVTVTAIVDTTFTFTVTGMATSTAVNGLTTTGSTSPTKIAFGHLVAGTPKVLSQRLNVTTNAKSGFMVTVYQDNNLQSSNGADIDGFVDGAYTNTPAVWAAPTNNIANENTWGHWGLTSSDDVNASEFSGSKFVAASTTPRQIFSHTGPADGTTANIGSTTVGYKIQITPLQEAADDYTTVLTYIATPTF